MTVTALYVECPLHSGDDCTLCGGTDRYLACIDCGEEAATSGERCRDCDIDHLLANVKSWWCPLHDVEYGKHDACPKCEAGGTSA